MVVCACDSSYVVGGFWFKAFPLRKKSETLLVKSINQSINKIKIWFLDKIIE
jgi:hypothetical protein